MYFVCDLLTSFKQRNSYRSKTMALTTQKKPSHHSSQDLNKRFSCQYHDSRYHSQNTPHPQNGILDKSPRIHLNPIRATAPACLTFRVKFLASRGTAVCRQCQRAIAFPRNALSLWAGRGANNRRSYAAKLRTTLETRLGRW